MVVPSIIRLKSKAFPKSRKVRLSRKNVLLRDDFTCHYCGQKKAKNLLNMDHVVPRARGGQTRWSNIVTACIECNSRKGDRTLAEAGLKLLRDPLPPNWSMAHKITFHLKDVPKEWVPYLGKSKGSDV
jgi:5-methylcytosine-specific restriction endonuclease McrA